jgi:hypothetical protein
MLVRFAPDMFIDDRFDCLTMLEVRKEIFRQQKFKNKYPWRVKFKGKIKCLPNSALTNDSEYSRYLEVINLLIDNDTINAKTGNRFDLSKVDRRILACALSFGCQITSGDDDLIDFAKQEFSDIFKGNISPLGIINRWVRKGLISWNDKLHGHLCDWNNDNEDSQPRRQKTEFKKLTGFPYTGS